MPTIPELAREALDSLTTITREDGPIVIKKDDAPEWVSDLVRFAHADMFPDDWQYKSIQSALEHIVEVGDATNDDAHEFADGNVDTYTSERLKWLASNLNRPAYCDEAVDALGIDVDTDIIDRIGLGQYMESSEVFALVVEALEERAADLD